MDYTRTFWNAAFCACILLALLILSACAPPPITPIAAQPATALPPPPSPKPQFNNLRAGWAYEAYPDVSSEKMRADFEIMRANGANALWIGHNNPGEVDAAKVEPGLSYAVYAALQNENDPLHADAQKMYDAVKHALEAARANKLRVVLPIGYQIQMGETWNRAHPNDLRLNADGTPLNHYNSGVTASPYSPQYRADMTRYYEWVQREIVEPYRDVLVMLSLADEPMGGDYSAHAQNEFAERYGKTMDALSSDEQWKLGEFQAGVIADYAAWSASAWKKINPQILTTMSFHGGDTARRVWGLPDIERLFSDTPENFIVTFDAYLHDDLPTKPANADEAAQLKLFLTTLGNYSRAYQKPIALWGGVNAWGLAQESAAPRDLPDAVSNLLLLYDLPVRAGGRVWGVFAWNFNVKQQGIENYSKPTTYNPQALQVAVNRALPRLRTRTIGTNTAPEIAILYSQRALYDALAKSRASDVPPDWFDAASYARRFGDRSAVLIPIENAAVLSGDAKYFVVAAPMPMLDQAALDFLREQFSLGRIIFGDAELARALNVRAQAWQAKSAGLPTEGGILYSMTR